MRRDFLNSQDARISQEDRCIEAYGNLGKIDEGSIKLSHAWEPDEVY